MNLTIFSKVLVNTRYLTSLLSFCGKGICAFMINYWLANNLRVEEFALWATVFSFGMILSVADFGVGQLILTTLHEKNLAVAGDSRLMTNAVTAMAVLSTLILLLTSFLFLFSDVLAEIRWKILIVSVILFRLVLIPFGAVLSAQDRYHERKFIEAISYGLGAIFILWATKVEADVSTMLLGMNFFITLGVLAIGLRAVRLGGARVEFKSIKLSVIKKIFTDSLPYFINNVSGLAIYAGFIAFSSLILSSNDIAKLSLLHNLMFMHLFQVFELIFRTVQTKMYDKALMKQIKTLIVFSYLGCLTLFAFIGVWLFKFFFGKYEYTVGELMVYTTFVFLEILYLMLTSKMQMKSLMKKKLQSLSLIKAFGFFVVLIFVSAVKEHPNLIFYSGMLVIYSVSMVFLGNAFAKGK
jgi:hypothetical protein